MKYLLIAVVATFGLSACKTARIIGAPYRTINIREQCRQDVQAQNMPPARETATQRAHRLSNAQAMFQVCLHERL